MFTQRKRRLLRGTIGSLFLFLALPAMSFAELPAVGIFFDSAVPQDSFAAYDVRDALVSKGFTPEMLPLSSLNATYANRKVVIAQLSNTAVTPVATGQGVSLPASLGEQAFVIRSSTTQPTSHWVFGGDAVGSMYGGFQIAEDISFSGFAGTYDKLEVPYVKERGIKLNLPFDKRSGTYNYDAVTSSSVYQAIKNVWDYNFWTEWFDIQARNRYNMISIWSNCPFTSMVKDVPGFELAALQDVQDSAGTVIIHMTIDEKILFWKKVMAYAHSRGFKVYFFNWNVYTGGASTAYPTLENGNCFNTENWAYFYKSMTKFLETYPDLDGFGAYGARNMGGATSEQKANFLWQSYGKAMHDYAIKPENRNRKLTFNAFLCGSTGIDYVMAIQGFKDLKALPNVRFIGTEHNYARCTMYSCATPTNWASMGIERDLTQWSLRAFIDVRNSDLFFCHWGDPAFARTFIKAIPGSSTSGWVDGINFGTDAFSPTRAFHAKMGPKTQLEIERLWYREKIWGRVAYDPQTTDEVFKNFIGQKYPSADKNALFTAWTNASKAFQVGNAFIRGAFENDYQYYPEGQVGSRNYVRITDFAYASPVGGSTLTNYTTVADSVKGLATAALATLNTMNSAGNQELTIAIRNLQALACLGYFVGEKTRAAKLNQAGNKTAAKPVMEQALCIWRDYANLMDMMHTGQQFTLTADILPDWNSLDSNIVNDYKTIAGADAVTPHCHLPVVGTKPVVSSIAIKQPVGVRALSTGSITLDLAGEKGFTVEIFSSNGAKAATLSSHRNNKGVSRLVLGKKLTEGVYIVRLKSAGQITTGKFNVCCD